MKNLIIASTSTIHGGTYLSYLLPEIAKLFSETEEILFIPYARPGGISHDTYTEIAQEAFTKIKKNQNAIKRTSLYVNWKINLVRPNI